LPVHGAPGRPSQAKTCPLISGFGRTWSPQGPFSQVSAPLVKAVQLSALRQANSPPVVRWRPSPLKALCHSFSMQAPTMSPLAATIMSRSVAKPSWKTHP
jgi:hypothetical protein